MPDNPDYGTLIYDLLTKDEAGDAGPLDAYVAADAARAVSADRRHVLVVRHQFGTSREGRWHGYSAQPDRNPFPGTPTRAALVLLRVERRGERSWHELTIPADTHIEGIRADGDEFQIRTGGADVAATGEAIFRVIADCAFGPPGISEAEIARGFAKLADHLALDVVGPAEPGAPLGSALPLVFEDPTLGWFRFRPERPARYTQITEDGPTYSLFADASGRFDAALARARDVRLQIDALLAAGVRLVQEIRQDFGKDEPPRLLGAEFHDTGIVRLSIDGGLDSAVSAELELATDATLHMLAIEEN